MSRDYLFGDAKTTAKAGDASRKKKALAAAEAKIKEEPNTENYVRLATAMFDVGRFDDAERILKVVLEQGEVSIQLLTDLGFIYKNLNQPDKAKEMFRRAVEVDPRHSLARCAESELWVLDPTYKPSWIKNG